MGHDPDYDNMEKQPKIEAPTEADIDSIARALLHAQHVTTEILAVEMDGTREDLALIQQLLDTRTIERELTYSPSPERCGTTFQEER
jgi:hypothetical protein